MEDAKGEKAGQESSKERVAMNAGAADNVSRRRQDRDSQTSPPHKARKMQPNSDSPRAGATIHSTTDSRHEGHDHGDEERRPRRPKDKKGEAKRHRKAKAAAEAERSCQYYIDAKGLRRVRPYIYEFTTHAKERWLGETVVDVFSKEFGANPRSHYESVIRSGLLTVNGKKIDLDYRLKNSDLVCNRTHRHEPPVAGGDITIVSESPTEIVVDKPCTIPVHPCGSYRFNSLFYILQRQRPDLSLRVCHRLDRLTSGLTIFAKTAAMAGVIQTQIGSGATRKTYLARVLGNFGESLPANRQQSGSSSNTPEVREADASGDGASELWWRYEPLETGKGAEERRLFSKNQLQGGEAAVAPQEMVVEQGSGDVKGDGGGVGSRDVEGRGKSAPGRYSVRVNCPIRVVDPKDGVYECHAEGKEAQTVFRKVFYDPESDTSVVECTPVHGRTHQIRLHLQWVGHPIANDPCYGGELYFRDPAAKMRAEQDPHFRGWKGTGYTKPSSGIATASEASKEVADLNAVGAQGTSGSGDNFDGCATKSDLGMPHAPEQIGVRQNMLAAGACSGNASVSGVGEGERCIGVSRTQADLIDDRTLACTTTGGPPVAEGGRREAEGAEVAHGKNLEGLPVWETGLGNGATLAGEASASSSLNRSDEIDDTEDKRDDEDDNAFMVRTCKMCQEGEQFRETQLHCLGIWLHALRYEGPDWVFGTKPPPWAIF